MKKNETQANLKEYGITECVPAKGRHFSSKDMVVTWICANASPTSWYLGSVIGALGFSGSFFVSALGIPIIYLLLPLVGFMGYKVGTSTMGLARVSFGIIGSKLPSMFNSLQFFGWCSVNTYTAAVSMTYLLKSVFSTPAYGDSGATGIMIVTVLFIMLVTGTVALLGGSRAIKLAQYIALIGLIVLSIWITFVALSTFSFTDIVAWQPETSKKLPIGTAIDLLAASGVAWAMAVADFTRYTKTPKAATIAPAFGASLGMFCFCLVV